MFKKRTEMRDRIIQFKRVFGSPDGKSVLYHLMDRYYILQDHKGDSFKEGQRSVVVEILKLCNVNIQQLDEMLKGEGE
jgi:hypothetical protein